jgi:hypothetical protein
MAKARTPIPASTAAAVLFAANRTCCVCRKEGEPVQLHHIDEDATNHAENNLAVLCLSCHDQTQIKGGFARRLDSAQIRLYRDDWSQLVAAARSTVVGDDRSAPSAGVLDAELATSLVEINREAGNWVNLAFLYDAIDNSALRDQAVEKALEEGVTEEVLILLRRLQGRLPEVPSEVIEQRLDLLKEKGAYRSEAVLYEDLSQYRAAAEAYVKGLHTDLTDYEDFTLAFYLKELGETSIVPGLFVNALQKAADEDDFWWQVRALEELEWTSELHAFVLANRERIEVDEALDEEQRCRLRIVVAKANDDEQLYKQACQDLERLEAQVDWNT